MDNIIFEKVWQDDYMAEIKVIAESEKAKASQTFYIDEEKLNDISDQIINYSKDYTKIVYIETGAKTGNFTPAFSMKMLNADVLGKVKIEVDIEIDDISDRSHRCIFYINTNINSLSSLGERLNKLYHSEIGNKICLQEV